MAVLTPKRSIVPTEQETQTARISSDALGKWMDLGGSNQSRICLSATGTQGVEITLPHSAVRLLHTALLEMAKGHSVTLLPTDVELTTQKAAEIMRVSRPSLIKLLDEKKLPYRKVGTHRRIRYEDVLQYLETERARRKKVMEELVAETESLGLYK